MEENQFNYKCQDFYIAGKWGLEAHPVITAEHRGLLGLNYLYLVRLSNEISVLQSGNGLVELSASNANALKWTWTVNTACNSDLPPWQSDFHQWPLDTGHWYRRESSQLGRLLGIWVVGASSHNFSLEMMHGSHSTKLVVVLLWCQTPWGGFNVFMISMEIPIRAQIVMEAPEPYSLYPLVVSLTPIPSCIFQAFALIFLWAMNSDLFLSLPFSFSFCLPLQPTCFSHLNILSIENLIHEYNVFWPHLPFLPSSTLPRSPTISSFPNHVPFSTHLFQLLLSMWGCRAIHWSVIKLLGAIPAE